MNQEMWEKRYIEESESVKETQNLESRINSEYYYLSKTHRKIASYILKHQKEVLNCSITVLAKKIGTTPATITRFCQELRYKGFNEMKFFMENDLALKSSGTKLVTVEEPLAVSVKKLLKYNMDALNETLLLQDERKLEQAIDKIVHADKVYFYAEGSSGSSADFGYRLFLQNGVPSFCFTDAAIMLLSATHLSEKDVVIGISYSGESENVLVAMRKARHKKAFVIGITGSPKSRFAKAASISLSYSPGIDDDFRYLHVARICEIAIIGILQTGIINNMTKNKDERLAELKVAIKDKR